MKNFRIQIILRVLVLAVTLAICVFLWFETPFYLSAILLLLLVIFQTVRLIHYVELTNRKLGQFLDSIRHSDFSRSFSGRNMGSSFDHLNRSFQEVVKAFEKQRMEKQTQFRYMQTVVQHVGVGLISFNQQGKVELLNTAAKRLFDISGLRRIEDLGNVSLGLLHVIKNIASGDREVIQIAVNNRSRQLAIRCTFFRLRDKRYKLVSFQDISPELEEKEMESWEKLTQVLAHEIMNSITPIASLSETVHMLLQTKTRENDGAYIINKEALKDVSEALDTIENRSEGLIRFVNSYRYITKVPEPEVERFGVKKMLQRVQNLNKRKANDQNVAVKLSVQPETIELTADPHLVEQVLINLTKNAFRAIKDQPKGVIKLQGNMAPRGGVQIQVTDNGLGIPPENLDKIFIPFYSTQRPHKQGGSGIGLSLSRQIMRAHGGNLSVQSTHGKGTTFILQF